MKFIIEYITRGNRGTLLLICSTLITGTLNTILTKLQDSVCVNNCESSQPEYFEQPFIQTIIMFIGELMCLFVWILFNNQTIFYSKIKECDEECDEECNEECEEECEQIIEVENKYAYGYLIIPVICDCLSSTMMNIGLLYVSASVFQMLRGSMVIFTGIISRVFLSKRYTSIKWCALINIFLGVLVVGYANINTGINTDKNGLIGTILILLAQMFSATQYVLEEKILVKYNISPLLSVGIEGVFGIILIIMITSFVQVSQTFDTISGLYQVISNPTLYTTSLLLIFSIALSNWFGLCITKRISSVSRSTIDISRTLIIWVISLSIGWEVLKYLQVIGFCVMICNIFLFNMSDMSNMII